MNGASISILTVLRANAGLMAMLALFLGQCLVLTLMGFMMSGPGSSLRPVWFLAGLMLPISLILAAGQLVTAQAPVPRAPSAALAVSSGQFTDRKELFGEGIPAELIRDAKRGMPGILDEAEVAEVGVNMNGETVLIAQFTDEESAKRGGAAYHLAWRLHHISGDEENGWCATRMQGDYVEMLRTGPQLFVWSGLTRESAAARRDASNLPSLFPSMTPAPGTRLFPALEPLERFFAPVSVKAVGILMLVMIYVIGFFKGAAWAVSSPATANAPALSAGVLTSRLLSVNDLDVPFTISQGSAPGELIADWRYADAKWIDLARAHGMRKIFRIRLTLDEDSHTVRATDYTAGCGWSPGRDGAHVEWKAATGIVFFQKEYQQVLGLQPDQEGRLKPDLSYSYKFDLREMKSPLVQAITRAGWHWRPTLWQGPAWLRWLTE